MDTYKPKLSKIRSAIDRNDDLTGRGITKHYIKPAIKLKLRV